MMKKRWEGTDLPPFYIETEKYIQFNIMAPIYAMKYLENFHSGVLKYMPWPKIEVKRNFSKQMCLGVILMLYLYVIKQWYINKPLLKPIGKIYKSFTRSTLEALHSKNKIVKKLWSEMVFYMIKPKKAFRLAKYGIDKVWEYANCSHIWLIG